MERSKKKVSSVQPKVNQCVVCKESGGSLMCGHIYYDRFEKEFDKTHEGKFLPGIIARNLVLEAAKKASNV